jgi:hypothetical protein
MGTKVTGPAALPTRSTVETKKTSAPAATNSQGWVAGSTRARVTSATAIDFRAVKDAVTRDPKALDKADDAVFANRAFMKMLLSQSGGLLERCPESVRADRELVEAAVRADPNAIEYASEALRADKPLGMLAVSGDGYSVTMLSAELQNDREIATQAMKTSPWCLRYLPDELRGDREIVRTASLGDYDALKDAKSSALFKDVPLMKELTQANPLTLDILKDENPATYAQLVRENPELKSANETLHARLEKAGITIPGRLGSLQTLETVLDNREHPDRTDGRPLAVMGFAEADHNGAMYHERFADVSKHYRMLYYEVGTDKQLFDSIREATRAQKADLVMIAGHGSETDTELSLGVGEKTTLDIGDREKLDSSGIAAGIAPGAHVVLKSCDTGGGKGETPNVANLLANAFPHAHVYAPTMSINNWLQVGPEGFKSPGYLAGEAYTYHVAPKEDAAPMVSAGR